MLTLLLAACHFFEHFTDQWGIFAIGGVPALLVIVLTVGTAVGVAEGDVTDVLRDVVVRCAEVEIDVPLFEIDVTLYRFDQDGLPAAVKPHDGDLLVRVDRKVYRCSETAAFVAYDAALQ